MKKSLSLIMLTIGLVGILSGINPLLAQTDPCDGVGDLDQYIKVNNRSFVYTNKVIACENQTIVLDFCCESGAGWNFTFTRPDGVSFPGGTNGVESDQILFGVSSTGTNAINEGVWEVNYTTPSGCIKNAFFEVNVIADLLPYVVDNNGNVTETKNIAAFPNDWITLGCYGSGIDESTNITWYRPDGVAFAGGTNNVYKNEIAFSATGGNLGNWTAVLNPGLGCSKTIVFNVSNSPDVKQYIRVNTGVFQQTNTIKANGGDQILLDFCCQGETIGSGWDFTFTRPDGVPFAGSTNGVSPDQITFTIDNSGPNLVNIGKWSATYQNPSGATKQVYFNVNGNLIPLNPHIKVNTNAFVQTNNVVANQGDKIVLDFCCMGGSTGWNFTYIRPDGAAFPGGTNGVESDQITFWVGYNDANEVNVGTWKCIYSQNGVSRIEYFDVWLNYDAGSASARVKQSDSLPTTAAALTASKIFKGTSAGPTKIDTKLLQGLPLDTNGEPKVDFSFYPNPVTEGYIDVDLSSFIGKKVTLSVVNAFGHPVSTFNIDKASSTTERVSLQGVQRGDVYLKVFSEGYKPIIKKIIIEE